MSRDQKLQVVRYPIHSEDELKTYNIYCRRNNSRSDSVIVNPIIGENCNSTICYIDLQDLAQSNLQTKTKCDVCRNVSDRYLFDVGFKQFLYRFQKISKTNLTPYQVRINPKKCLYEISEIDRGMIGAISHNLGEHIGMTVNEGLSFSIIEKPRLCYEKINKHIKSIISKLDETQQNQDQVMLYSWCRHVDAQNKPYFLMFFKGENQPKMIQINFGLASQNQTTEDINEAFAKMGCAAFYAKQKIFVVVLSTQQRTYHYAASLKTQAKMFSLQRGFLNMKKIGDETAIRKLPSILIDQSEGNLYILGGFDEHSADQKPYKIIEYENIFWDTDFKGALVKDTPQLFRQVQIKRKHLGGNNNGIRGTTIIRYTPMSPYEFESTSKKAISKRKAITWYSFGGSYCQSGGLIAVKIFSQKPCIREIIYKTENQFSKKIEYTTNPDEIIMQQCGRKDYDFCINHPFVLQIPQIQDHEIDRYFRNRVLVFGGSQSLSQIRASRSKIYLYDIMNSYIQLLENKQFPNKDIASYADNNATLLKNKDGNFYIRMTYPLVPDLKNNRARYLVAEFILKTKNFRTKQFYIN